MKFPFYKQHDAMQCGITCLQMICKYYGKEYSLEKLSHYCFATAEGVSLVGISEAATKLGLHTVSGRMTINQVYEATATQNHNYAALFLSPLSLKTNYHLLPPRLKAITDTLDELDNPVLMLIKFK